MPINDLSLSLEGLNFIKGYESFVAYPYDDHRPAVKGKYPEWKGGPLLKGGTATVGYGHTDSAKYPLKVVPGIRLTEAEASKILDVDLDECEEAVNRLVKVKITQGQFDALVSFTFNCGEANLKKLIAPLNKGDYAGTRAKFDLYIRSEGEVMNGLIRRRDGEQALWDARPKALPQDHEVENVPERVDAPPNPGTKRGIVLGGGTAATLIAVKEGTDVATGMADSARNAVASVSGLASSMGSPWVLAIIAAVLLVGAGIYVWRSRAKTA
ncbi:lysozyme [Roseixanthobacter pseudopolyaromaticivorans]|uniref:lysozyme n=1 Tax=Xanthobacteraceae TaxID=335928 RepID=UPI003727E352